MAQPINETFFTPDNVKALGGAISSKDSGPAEISLSRDFKAKAIPMWTEAPGGVKRFDELMVAISKVSAIEAGDAEKYYQTAIKLMQDQGFDASKYMRVKATGSAPKLIEGYKEVDGKIVVAVDINKFKADMVKVTASISREEVVKQVVRQSAEQDLTLMMKELLVYPEAVVLVGILSARLLVGRQERETIDSHIMGVTVLKNRAGKLSTGLVRLGGFIGLATVKEEPRLVSVLRFVKNPLLGEDPVDRPLVKRGGESEKDFTERKERHNAGWSQYKGIMQEMKSYRKFFEELDPAVKVNIKREVMSWTIGMM